MHVPRDVLPVQVSPRSIRLLWHRRSHPSSISGMRTEKRMSIIMACTVFSSNMHVPYIRWFRPSTHAPSRPHPAQHDTLKKGEIVLEGQQRPSSGTASPSQPTTPPHAMKSAEQKTDFSCLSASRARP
ncbi:hypothetical protein BV20DRAFT_148379 [Pilatotrama ljubarskyi]|nr:hypothetical protein BV20DRAFT_148379 [Pilatotrama ljubarskyi]